jgi:hypothetical protein
VKLFSSTMGPHDGNPSHAFPTLAGSHLGEAELGTAALAFVRTLCHVLALDAAVVDEVGCSPWAAAFCAIGLVEGGSSGAVAAAWQVFSDHGWAAKAQHSWVEFEHGGLQLRSCGAALPAPMISHATI